MTDTPQYPTEQEAFWAGEFGDGYITRNQGEKLLAANLNFFVKALRNAKNVRSCIEFGANIGMNLRALRLLYPDQKQAAIEINHRAAEELTKFLVSEHVFNTSILEFQPAQDWDLVLIKGVLIHINPETLPAVYDKLAAASSRYVLICEYYSPAPISVQYRGHAERLFKRDFAGEFLERHAAFSLVDYGFAYRRDPSHPQDDITWFLMEKT
jgi:pseudaminic acid biosynthesis-associated methylase